ncbi:hypothetical protein KC343_g13658 [Hortaea werneckii]|uniref:Uncharacterized protein n=1 Tax=Hortaea werneckii TaxID=91943 RepID=A0A3M7DEA8_HORWE|nr:hypothetical protein KC352_g37661 [Hortaea werneckii]KAI7551924.1 hypothetical protein KC317_g13886 [Hortaea werneckii]KAI7599649.1 hypothetical protein KC346_g13637 [Hortaea werneckii]KAI7605694.1 hypothetical protein KC343_g13658 [Hortaea werneckii]KAI7641698.1 hypothetical protein KC319_g13379 [Hortaea werneckii]
MASDSTNNNTTTTNGDGSGQSSPGYPKTMSTGGRPRSDSDTTVITEVTQETVESNRSFNYPNPPINTPYTRSEIGELPLVNSDALFAKLGQMVTVTPPSSVNEIKAAYNDTNDTHDLATPTPDHHTEDDYFGDGPVFPEASAWEGFAEEDVEKGLQRLAMLAKDLHKVDNTKTAEQHYNERLSKILKEAEFQFDASKLK